MQNAKASVLVFWKAAGRSDRNLDKPLVKMSASIDWAIGPKIGLLELASIFGCSLNGEEAKLSLSPKSGLAEVVGKKTASRAVFNWSTAAVIMRERKGAFVTRERNESPMRWERRGK